MPSNRKLFSGARDWTGSRSDSAQLSMCTTSRPANKGHTKNAMTIKEAMQKAVKEGNATLAGRICDKMRFELGATYNDIEARFVVNTGCTKSDFEALMYYATLKAPAGSVRQHCTSRGVQNDEHKTDTTKGQREPESRQVSSRRSRQR